ncbi:MAG TPA: hypothetical protein PKE55_05415, partial [Kiritimatiellia bacterium]|nr:hypothetical protein [Kiritimatiellia bacterium]
MGDLFDVWGRLIYPAKHRGGGRNGKFFFEDFFGWGAGRLIADPMHLIPLPITFRYEAWPIETS